MKHIIILALIFSSLLAFGCSNQDSSNITTEDNATENIAIENNETNQFKDIESMEKAISVEDAFECIIGKDCLLNDSKIEKNDERMQEAARSGAMTYPSFTIHFEMKPGIDSRMEMIDFLHYIQFSKLSKQEKDYGYQQEHLKLLKERYDFNPYYFDIFMYVYTPMKPGMNKPEAHQSWIINSKKIEVMDFSDKETMLGEIHSYGNFSGVNPSGMHEPEK